MEEYAVVEMAGPCAVTGRLVLHVGVIKSLCPISHFPFMVFRISDMIKKEEGNMKKLLFIIICLAISVALVFASEARGRSGSSRSSYKSSGKSSSVHVQSHTTKKGTYVKSHRRTAPNKSKRDNWSSKGNVNPYTGKAGTKDPDR